MMSTDDPDPALLAAVEELLDLGELDAALDQLEALAGPRDFGDCPAPIPAMAATVLLTGGAYDDASAVLERALGHTPQDADLLTVRAELHAARWNLQGAVADAQAALALDADLPQAHRVLGVCADATGDGAGADRHHQAAHRLDPDAYPAGIQCNAAEFDAEVEQAMAELRADPLLQPILATVRVVIDDLPGAAVRELPECTPDLLGLCEAVDEAGSAPAALHLFRRNLARSCDARGELADEIRTTIWHELGPWLAPDYDEDEDEFDDDFDDGAADDDAADDDAAAERD